MSGEAPGGWELQRAVEQLREDSKAGFSQLNQRLDRLVTTDAFAAEQRRVDDRLKDLADDIASERADRVAAVADEKTLREAGDARQQTQLDKLTTNIRWVAASIALPVGLFIANLVINSRGGV